MDNACVLTCREFRDNKVISRYECAGKQANVESSFGDESFADILLKIIVEKIKE